MAVTDQLLEHTPPRDACPYGVPCPFRGIRTGVSLFGPISGLRTGSLLGSLQGGGRVRRFWARFGLRFGLRFQLRSGSVWGPIWGPSGGGHFRLRSFSGPPHTRICFIRRSQNFHVLKMGVLGGGPIWPPKGPPSGIKFGLRFGVQLGSPIGLHLGPFGGPLRAPERGSLFGTRNASQTLYIMVSAIFGPSKRGSNRTPWRDPIWPRGRARKSPKRGSRISENVVITTLLRFQGVLLGVHFGVLFEVISGVHFRVHFGAQIKETKMVHFGPPRGSRAPFRASRGSRAPFRAPRCSRAPFRASR